MRHTPSSVAVWVALAVAVAAAARAGPPADWPHVRGPAYDGHSAETGLADAWPADGPPVLWDRELGQGDSGLVVAGGRVFTQFQNRPGQFVAALHPATGAEAWR